MKINTPFSLIQISTSGYWDVLLGASKLITLCLSLILILSIWNNSESRKRLILKQTIIIVLLTYAYLIEYFSVRLFRSWSQDQIGKYFLPPHSPYYTSIIWRFSYPFVEAIATGIGLSLLFLGLMTVSKGRYLGKTEVFTGFFMGLILGLENTIVAIIMALFLAIIYSVINLLLTKAMFIRLLEPLYIATFISLYWGNTLAHLFFKT